MSVSRTIWIAYCGSYDDRRAVSAHVSEEAAERASVEAKRADGTSIFCVENFDPDVEELEFFE